MPLLDTVVGPASDRDRMVFNTLAVLGLVLMAMTLAPALLDTLHVHRSKSWCGQIVAWMVYSGGFLILYGRQDGPDPPFGICVFQAAMIYAAPVMTATASTCFMVDFYFRLSSALFSSKLSLMKRVLPLVIPSAFFAYVFVEVLLLIQDPTAVQREESHLYCHISVQISATITEILIMGASLILFPLQVWITIVVYRNWAKFRHNTLSSLDNLSSFIRFALFNSTLAAGIILFVVHEYTSATFNWALTLPAPSILVWLACGTQLDILNTWLFWLRLRRRPADDPPMHIHNKLHSDV